MVSCKYCAKYDLKEGKCVLKGKVDEREAEECPEYYMDWSPERTELAVQNLVKKMPKGGFRWAGKEIEETQEKMDKVWFWVTVAIKGKIRKCFPCCYGTSICKKCDVAGVCKEIAKQIEMIESKEKSVKRGKAR